MTKIHGAAVPAIQPAGGLRANPALPTVEVLGFDGDDTLWHNESLFSITQDRFRGLLSEYVGREEIDKRLLAAETRNLRVFGYGVKGFMLSMIETALEVSFDRIPAAQIRSIIELGREMLTQPVELLDGARATLEALHERYRLILVTKGDLFDQETKLARSGLANLFWQVEIISEKDVSAYQRILKTHSVDPTTFLMVGNSVRSDILPVLELGGSAVHVPYHMTWEHERAEIDEAQAHRVWTLQSISQLPALVSECHP